MRKVVVLGGSAGGIEAFCRILKELPADFPAPLLAVIHIGEGESMLVEVLQRCTKLKVVGAGDPEPIEAGRVYIASPNRHLAVRKGCVLAAHGPRENRHRPAIDALFRSAARAYRSAVVGVIVSGALDDGVAGALAIEARGGTVVVQDPNEALNPEMPSNVLRRVKTDYHLTLKEIAELLVKLANNGQLIKNGNARPEDCAGVGDEESLPVTDPFAYTCPDCGGSLLMIKNGNAEQFRCNVGHIYSLDNFSEAHSHALERALWMTLQRLNERRSIQEHLATQAKDRNLRRRYHENAAAAAEDMRLLKEILARLV